MSQELQPSAAAAAPAVARPLRRRLARVLRWTLGLALAAFCILHLGLRYQRHFELQRLRSWGQLDFSSIAPLPPEQIPDPNAADLYRAAFALLPPHERFLVWPRYDGSDLRAGQPLPDWELAEIRTTVRDHIAVLDALEAVAARRLPCLWVTDWSAGARTPLDHVQQIEDACHLLILRFRVQVADDAIPAALRSLDTQQALAESLLPRPSLAGASVYYRAMETNLRHRAWLLSTGRLSVADLQAGLAQLRGRPPLAFYNMLRHKATLDAWALAAHYDRVAAYGFPSVDRALPAPDPALGPPLGWPDRLRGRDLLDQVRGLRQIHDELWLHSDPDDAMTTVELTWTSWLQASSRQPPEFVHPKLLAPPSDIGERASFLRLYRRLTELAYSACSDPDELARLSATADTDSQLARHVRENWDPWMNNLQFQVTDQGFVIYSFGENQTSDAGADHGIILNRYAPDIAVPVFLPAGRQPRIHSIEPAEAPEATPLPSLTPESP